MWEDKYIGLALAVSSSLAIGTSFILTKKGLNQAGESSAYSSASDNYAYFQNPIWWAGMTTLIIGEVANFAAYTFAPPILVTPLGALSVIIGAILASFLLHEELGHLGRLGCSLCLLGSLIIVLHAPPDKEVETVDEILRYATQPGFLMYCFTVLVFSLVMIYFVVPKYGRTNPTVYISICSLVGSVSVMAIKGFGVAVKLTLNGNNQFTLLSTYVFGITVVGCILVQMNYFNKALDTFSTNVVNPMYYVGFSTATIVASVILFQGFNTDDPANSISLLAGFVTTFLGVHLLELSRKPDPNTTAGAHSALEGGLMNPRLSIHGRMSIDGWSGAAGTPIGGSFGPTVHGHGRRSSLYRNQTQTLFNAFDEDDEIERERDGVGLDTLHEAEDDELEADERTALRSGGGRRDRISFGNGHALGNGHARRGSRSTSHTPLESRSPR
ncbi:magnesium transporter NIPA-domain-containing protein [Epithele typhae]|uniref:magnesium transporter NIPA-domain-containing protein n=1 Tax=Epithele typhae TaxID=378194 RepID=UPI002007C48F|nr:magnesium transporter NIPA-domain-containing protein [Epithele typhae]KAH9930519.1 magnesium transporter NIPA-domain-containing protein [Epithele typhae]